MTIQEAIKSGKPFKRSAWPNKDYWITVRNGAFVRYGEDGSGVTIYPHEVLESDWITKDTESQ